MEVRRNFSTNFWSAGFTGVLVLRTIVLRENSTIGGVLLDKAGAVRGSLSVRGTCLLFSFRCLSLRRNLKCFSTFFEK